jgi:hypothetical protein
MIVTASERRLEGTADAPAAFRVANTEKMFDILSSGIYADKVGAVVRELATNAADAHVAANNPLPFRVHLPTEAEPYFEVRDFGSGLSDDDIRGPDGVYTTYGGSKRSSSNDFTGCWGLGSKTPFCVAEQFEVTSYQRGVRSNYLCYRDADGIPNVSRTSVSMTDEADGLRVRVDSSSEDQHVDFIAAATKRLRWLRPKLEIIGLEKFEFAPLKVEFELDGCTTTSSGPALAVMGGVEYTIDHQQLGRYTDSKIFEHSLVLQLPIGAVDVTTSREQLSYTPRTVECLQNEAKRIKNMLLEKAKAELTAAATPWEQVKLVGSRWKHWLDSICRTTIACKYQLTSDTGTDRLEVNSYLSLRGYTVNAPGLVHLVEMTRKYKRLSNSWSIDWAKTPEHLPGRGSWLFPDGPPVYIIDTKDGRRRIEQAIRERIAQSTMTDRHLGERIRIIALDYRLPLVNCEAEFNDFDQLGLLQVAIRTSTLPAPVAVAKQRRHLERTTGNVLRLATSTHAYADCWRPTDAHEITKRKPATYVIIDNSGKPVSAAARAIPIRKIWPASDLMPGGEIFGVSKEFARKLESKNWTELSAAVAAVIANELPTALAFADLRAMLPTRTIVDLIQHELLHTLRLECPLRRILERFNEFDSKMFSCDARLTGVERLARQLNVKNESVNNEYRQLVKIAEQRYPMLRYLNSGSSTLPSALFTYVNNCDELAQRRAAD